MTHQNHQTNGASLEDCHTNFFALTDLSGLKWRRFVQGERPNASSNPLDDPVLRSYSKCLEVDIPCVWRRVAAPKPAEQDNSILEMTIPAPVTGGTVIHPPLSLTAAKELWIFWYGEEPDLTDLVDPELLKSNDGDKGSWEGGLSYECRSLLFKALHNRIERCLLSRDVVRLGRWFVQPSSHSDRAFSRSSSHFSFAFAFFVHGDNTVCASMDIREHPPVRPLMVKHLEEALAQQSNNSTTNSSSNTSSNNNSGKSNNGNNNSSNGSNNGTNSGNTNNGSSTIGNNNNNNINGASDNNNNGSNGGSGSNNTEAKPRSVILAPFGLAATLTGQSYKASDPQTQKVLDDWSAFYPISNKNINLSESADTVPPIVEIMTGGMKMRYPSKYVLVTDIDDWSPPASPSNSGNNSTTQQQPQTPTKSIVGTCAITDAGNNMGDFSPLHTSSGTANGKSGPNGSSGDNKSLLLHPPLTIPEAPTNDLGNPYSMSSELINNSPAVLLPERAWQDCIMRATPTPMLQPAAGGGSPSPGSNKSLKPKDPSSMSSSVAPTSAVAAAQSSSTGGGGGVGGGNPCTGSTNTNSSNNSNSSSNANSSNGSENNSNSSINSSR